MERYKLIRRKGRKYLVLRWHDGFRWREKSTRKTRRREAEKVAKEIMMDSNQGELAEWAEFIIAYKRDHLEQQSAGYKAVFNTAVNHLEDVLSPKSANEINTRALARFRTELRQKGIAATTITTYLKHLRGAFNWAYRHGYMREAVKVEMPRIMNRGQSMKGRPLTGEEFDRVIKAIPKAFEETPIAEDPEKLLLAEEAIKHLMNGLWLSGLRLSESLSLTWDDFSRPAIANIDGRRPMVEIPAEFDKSKISRKLPLTPDFVEFLRKTTKSDREGYVFNPISISGQPLRSSDRVGRIISKIGEHSKVLVGAKGHPTAHDFRRSFASRWALRVTPTVLKELMRHADIKTTLTYYVGESAERTANEVWDAFVRTEGAVLGDSSESELSDRTR